MGPRGVSKDFPACGKAVDQGDMFSAYRDTQRFGLRSRSPFDPLHGYRERPLF